jgi:hypothetical protein
MKRMSIWQQRSRFHAFTTFSLRIHGYVLRNQLVSKNQSLRGNALIFTSVFVATGTCIPNRCLAMIISVLHKSLPSVCVYMCIPPIVARQRLGKHVTASTNTHVTIDELLYASFSMRTVLYKRKVGD